MWRLVLPIVHCLPMSTCARATCKHAAPGHSNHMSRILTALLIHTPVRVVLHMLHVPSLIALLQCAPPRPHPPNHPPAHPIYPSHPPTQSTHPTHPAPRLLARARTRSSASMKPLPCGLPMSLTPPTCMCNEMDESKVVGGTGVGYHKRFSASASGTAHVIDAGDDLAHTARSS